MTQFENKLKELLAELDAQIETHEQEEWAKISNTTLAEYRKEMRAKSDKQFDYARWKLEETLAQFATENLNE